MTELARLVLSVDSTDVDKGTGSLDRIGDQAERAEQRTTRATGQMSGGFKAMGAAIAAVASSAALRKIVGDLAAFDQAMRGVQAVSGATADQMAVLEKQARELGATSIFSAQQAADAQRFLAQAGFEVNEVLGATPGILELAAAAGMDLGSAADLASNALSGFRLEVSELGRVNDVLAATAASANTNVMQLGQALSFAAPISTAAGVSVEETAAAIGALSDAGIQASRAGTGFVGFIRQLSNITPQAAEALKSYGVSVDEVDISTRGLQPVIDRLAQANISTADAFQIFGSEAGAAAQILLGASGRVQELTDNLEGAEGAASRMAGILGEGLAGSIKGLGSAAAEAVLQLGDGGMGGALQHLIDTTTGVITAYNGMLPVMVENNKATQEQADRYQAIANAIELVAIAAAGKGVSALTAYTAAKVRATTASLAEAKAEADATAQIARREAANKTAAAASAQVAAQRAAATRQEIAAEVSRTQALQASLAAERALEVQRLQAQITSRGRQLSLARLADLRLSEVAATNQVTAATARLTNARLAETSATRLARLASVEKTKADVAATAAATAATRATAGMTIAARAGAGAMALLGGPVGAVTTAVLALTMFVSSADDSEEAASGLGSGIDRLAGSFDRLTVAQAKREKLNLAEPYRDLQEEAREAYDRVQYLEGLLRDYPDSKHQESWNKDLVEAQARFDDARQEAERYSETLQRLDGIIAGRNSGDGGNESAAAPPPPKPRGGGNDKATDSIQKRVAALQLEAETLGMTARQEELYRARKEGATAAQLAAIDGSYRQIEAYEAEQAALEFSIKSRRDAAEILAEMDKERATDIDAGEQLLERYMTEEELLREHHERRLETLETARAADFENEAKWNSAIEAENKRFNDAMEDMDKARWMAQMDLAASGLSEITGLMSSENRKMFEIGKAAAIAQTLVSIPSSAQKAYDAMAGIPVVGPALGAAAAAAAVVAGMGRLQAIQSANFGGGGGGGSGGGGISGGVQSVPAAPAPVQLDGASSDGRSGDSISVTINGSVVGATKEDLEDMFAEALRDKIANKDYVLIDSNSRNGRTLR